MSLANYKWSSMLTWFSTLTKANERTAIDMLAHFSANVAPWKTDLDFRTAISFSHELVHYYQDILTGVGHWDFLTNRNLFPVSNMWAKEMLTVTSKMPFNKANIAYQIDYYYKYCYDEFFKTYENYSNECIYPQNYSDTISIRKAEIEKYVNENFKTKIIINNSEGFLIENLFESEAVATVHLSFLDLMQTDEQYEIYKNNDFLILPHKMDSLYNETISIIYKFLNEILDGKQNSSIIYKTALTFLTFLIDISAAYPTPEIIQNSSLSKDEFNPGIKFLRLLNSVHTLNEINSNRFIEALKNNNSDEAEQALLDNCEVNYPHSKQIYSGWLFVFESINKETDDVLIQLRLNSCKNRIQSNSNSFNMKNLSQLIFHNIDIPINFLTSPKGITTYLMNHQLEKKFRMNMVMDLMNWNREIKLFDLFYTSGEFSCPLAEANICSISKEQCFKIKSLYEIPTDSACLMNSRLSSLIK